MYVYMYIYKHFHIYVYAHVCTHTCIYAHKSQFVTLCSPSQLTLALWLFSVTVLLAMAFQLRTFLRIPLPLYRFKGQVVLPPMALFP